VLFLGRIHPKKGLEQLILAWKEICFRHQGWQLNIVGPLDSLYAQELRIKLKEAPGIYVLGPLYGAEKIDAYRQADIFVLPSQNENFAMTVAEALAQETPVISTTGTPWAGLETHGCGWWIDQGVAPLATALDEAMATPAGKLVTMGQAGRQWMERDFNWDAVSASMHEVYRWLCNQRSAPDCVRER
jgi:glycosyltransferase involved in cell wall biosynthesis